ncbi:MAG: serine/threonine protein kinase [Acidimicrobiales bacterium]|nr:serine/threonine protein kinase [Acidimicrobiales bacterium]
MEEPTAIAADEATNDPCPHCGREVGGAWIVCAWCGQQIAAPAELPAGSKLADGRYQVLAVIGRGGFGITYEMGDRRLQRRVAVKELFPESAVRHGSMVLTPPQARAGFREARERFLREARVLARFTQPGIVRVYEVFEEHGTAYLVMELLDGRTLVDILRARNEPFSEAEVLDVAGRVAAALRPVHAAGVLHRDINPSNVMLTRNGRIVVIDFGLARDFEEGQTVGMTRVVTPGYAPLEQYRGEARFGPSTDVYGLAATCYRLATGRVPVAAVERDGGGVLPAPSKLNPAIPKQLSDALLDGLELEPSHRPQDLDSFLARLGIRRLPDGPRSLLVDAVDPELLAGKADSPWISTPVEPLRAEMMDHEVTDHEVMDHEVTDHDRTGATVIVARAPMAAPGGDVTMGPGPTVAAAVSLPPIRPLTSAHSVPGSDARLPVAVGPDRPGRRKVTIPLTVLAVAVASAAPVLVTALVVFVALPWLATFGDSVAHRLRASHGVAGGWAEQRLSPGALAPARFARNLAVSIVRASPIIGIGAVLLGAWYALDRTSLPDGIIDLLLRIVGALVVGLVVVTAREGSARFRTGLGIDELVARFVPDGRTTERVVISWLVVALLVAGSLWLAPDPFPLP